MEDLTIRKAEQDSSSVSQSLTQSKRSLHNVYEWLQKDQQRHNELRDQVRYMIKSVKKSNQELEEEFGPSDPLNSAEVQRGELEFFDRLAISALRIPTAYPVAEEGGRDIGHLQSQE
ncbi:g4790 [Coccomyxa viridis]|uniref:G4790 protein n=1 Tax=Coccomyxa viridis TaxID=1274662 RepID=A0ABP1FR52_9CHLO